MGAREWCWGAQEKGRRREEEKRKEEKRKQIKKQKDSIFRSGLFTGPCSVAFEIDTMIHVIQFHLKNKTSYQ
jgi:hypothetical protein